MGNPRTLAVAAPDWKRTGAGTYATDRSGLSGRLTAQDQLVHRIRTGCVYEAQPAETFGVLVTRDDPRMRWQAPSAQRTQKGRRVLAPIDAHWPTFAPSVFLLTGHETACRARRCRSDGRCSGHAPLQLGWPAFAAAYRAELEQCSFLTRLAVIRQVVGWLQCAPTVTILSFERRAPERGPMDNVEDAGRSMDNWAQRHIFRDWLVSLLPLAIPLMRMQGQGSATDRRRRADEYRMPSGGEPLSA